MPDIRWIHDEALRADHPVFTNGDEDCRSVFIWDEAYFKAMHYGFARLVFVYEALGELPVDIVKGDTVTILTELATENGRIITADTPSRELLRRIEALRQIMPVKLVREEDFVRFNSPPDLRRFFRYWNKARKSAMQFGGGMPDLFD
ncbi:hypothetical protein AB8880_12705 [Alphaproteobacteria bacterium LSUCC0684]